MTIRAWRPNLDAAVEALATRARIADELDDYPQFRVEFRDDACAVLDASGANAEIERLRAVLHAAQAVITELREESRQQIELLLALTIEPALAPTQPSCFPDTKDSR